MCRHAVEVIARGADLPFALLCLLSEDCATLRAAGRPGTRDVPVIMVSVRREEDDRVQALQADADDYVVKPFSPRELRAEFRAIEIARPGAGSEFVVSIPLARSAGADRLPA